MRGRYCAINVGNSEEITPRWRKMYIRQVVETNHEDFTCRQARHEIAMISTGATMPWRVYAKDGTIGEQNIEV
jgi:hypothetical protein